MNTSNNIRVYRDAADWGCGDPNETTTTPDSISTDINKGLDAAFNLGVDGCISILQHEVDVWNNGGSRLPTNRAMVQLHQDLKNKLQSLKKAK